MAYNGSMISVYEDSPNIVAKDSILPLAATYYDEVRGLMPELPSDLTLWLDNWCLIDETGTGGFAYAANELTLAFDMNFPDKALQRKDLRATIFHESFHLVQGHTQESPRATYTTALDNAIYEGCAVVFEREYAGATPLWGLYDQHGSSTLMRWRAELQQIPIETYLDAKTNIWEKWAFYDEVSNERWRLYKAGTWIVDQALRESGKNILELRTLSSTDIIGLVK